MKKYVAGALAAALLAAGVLAGRIFVMKYNPGAPDPSDMLIMRDDSETLAVIEDGSVPLAGGPGDGSMPAIQESPYIQQVVDLVNVERTKAGLNPLNKSSEICTAAQIRAVEISTSFDHTRPDGRRYRTVLADCGISTRSSGENIAGGYRSPQEVVQAWMGSEGHRANIMNPDYTDIGIGYYKAGNMQYWSQLFAY